jgi:hypothetical protein
MIPAIGSAVLFVVSLILFLLTTARRNRLERAGLPVPPERRPLYDQDFMIQYAKVALATTDPSSHDSQPRTALHYYAQSILPLDIAFAAAFSLFIVFTAVLLMDQVAAHAWAARVCAISACFGVVYGVADVGEDIKLRSIFAHAIRVRASETTSESRLAGTALADAAEVDAANALTVVKMAAIIASGIGLLAFGVLELAGRLQRYVDRRAGGAQTAGTGSAGASGSSLSTA